MKDKPAKYHRNCGGDVLVLVEHARLDCNGYYCSIDDCQKHLTCIKCGTIINDKDNEVFTANAE